MFKKKKTSKIIEFVILVKKKNFNDSNKDNLY